MKYTHSVYLLLLFTLAGCSNAPVQIEAVKKTHPVYWSAFPDASPMFVETRAELLAVPPQAHTFISQVKEASLLNETPFVDELIKALFSRQTMGINYYSDANFTVAETFTARQANCLSLTMMTYALAKEGGLEAQLNDVLVPEYWSRNQGNTLLNGHVNITLTDTNAEKTQYRVVDFDGEIKRQEFPYEKIGLNRFIAMFYNNKGAEAMVNGHSSLAFSYFAKALEEDHTFDIAWVNLGVLYRRNDMPQFAEEAYLRALALDSDSLTVRENLAILYRATGRTELAVQISNEVHQRRISNPYYHLILGDTAFEQGEYTLAQDYYKRAYRLDKNNHYVLFALGKIAFVDGEVDSAQSYLKRALSRAHLTYDKERYSSKLGLLASVEFTQPK